MATSREGPRPSEDLFDAVLNVESSFHDSGYNKGLEDGAQAGLAEGRAFGMQKGFEKFLESGRLAAKAIVWANRLPPTADSTSAEVPTSGSIARSSCSLHPIPNNARLEKNITSLYGLVDPKMLSTENSDAAVQDFDDRMKRAEGKVRIIERMVGGNSQKEGATDG
jgi:hypothetical protein